MFEDLLLILRLRMTLQCNPTSHLILILMGLGNAIRWIKVVMRAQNE